MNSLDHLKATGSPSEEIVSRASEYAFVDFVRCIQSALGTEESGDALIEVARNAHRAEQTCARLVRELDEVRNELEDDFDVIDGDDGQPRPNKAMRLANMIDEAIYGPGGF